MLEKAEDNMKRLIIAILLAGLFLTPCAAALADGGFFVDIEKDIYEPSQKAVIFYAEGREDMVLSVKYQGNADDFAWVVPVPSQPDVEVADPQLFWELAELTRLILPHQSDGFFTGAESPQGHGVDVLEEKTVGPYDVAVLSAENPSALADWLNANGYSFPETGEAIIEEYIRKGWYFVASKISTGEAGITDEGNIEPLILSFDTDRIVYPLKISSVSSDFCEVLLYVFARRSVVPDEYRFLTLNTQEQVAYIEREENVFYLESREEIPFGAIVNNPGIGQVLYYREYGKIIEIEEYWNADEDMIYRMENTFSEMYYLTKLRADITSGNMVDIELVYYDAADYPDSDNDGWNNTEEAIAGSNPQKSDTDGDGITDPEDATPLTRDTLPDWSLPVALAGSLAIAAVIWLISRRTVCRRIKNWDRKPAI
jgi:hypothetical protein